VSEQSKLEDGIREVLRPVVVDVVREEVDQALAERRDKREEIQYLTTTEYARLHRTTAGAVLARIHRSTLNAIRPPGAREWLIPIERDADNKHGGG
jgi:hypothetical protein